MCGGMLGFVYVVRERLPHQRRRKFSIRHDCQMEISRDLSTPPSPRPSEFALLSSVIFATLQGTSLAAYHGLRC